MAGRPGRPSKLTPQLAAKIRVSLERGHTITGACGLAGLGKRTYHDWIERGEAARGLAEQGIQVPDTETPYVAFAAMADLARDHGEGWLLEQALAAGPSEWQKYLTILERTRPDRWRRPSAVEFAGAGTTDGTVEVRLAFTADPSLVDELRLK